MEKKVILVTGIGGNVGQGILRNVKDSFPEIHLIGTDIASFTSGNYLCDKTYQVPYSYDENYIPSMQKICEQENVDLIIPSTDYEVYFLAQNKKKIPSKIVASDYKTTEKYLDKYKSYLYHKENNIPFAQSWTPSDFVLMKEDVIAKPRKGRGSRGIIINPNNPNDLPSDYMIQKLLKGKEITTAAYVTRDNKLHGIFTMERQLTNGTTSKAKVIFNYDERLREIANKMIKLGGIKGAFNIQSIVTEDQRVIPFEINCRISGTNSIRHNLGFKDVVYTVQEYLFESLPSKATPIAGVATRILLDVIYPNANEELKLNNKTSNHLLY